MLDAADLATLEIVLIPRDYHRAHYDAQISSLEAMGFAPRIVATNVSTTQSQMAMASAGLGACLLSEGTHLIPDDLVLKPTKPELCKHALALFWPHENRNVALADFRQSARELAP